MFGRGKKQGCIQSVKPTPGQGLISRTVCFRAHFLKSAGSEEVKDELLISRKFTDRLETIRLLVENIGREFCIVRDL